MNMEINPSEYKILIVDDVMSNVLLLKVLLTMRNSRLLLQVTGGKRWNRWKRKILIWFCLT